MRREFEVFRPGGGCGEATVSARDRSQTHFHEKVCFINVKNSFLHYKFVWLVSVIVKGWILLPFALSVGLSLSRCMIVSVIPFRDLRKGLGRRYLLRALVVQVSSRGHPRPDLEVGLFRPRPSWHSSASVRIRLSHATARAVAPPVSGRRRPWPSALPRRRHHRRCACRRHAGRSPARAVR